MSTSVDSRPPNMTSRPSQIFKNGNVWRWKNQFEGDFERVDIKVKDGVVVDFAVSPDTEDAEIIDLKNSFVLPGLTDSHLHVDFSGCISEFVLLFGCASVQDLITRLQTHQARVNGWILGVGWDYELLLEYRSFIESQNSTQASQTSQPDERIGRMNTIESTSESLSNIAKCGLNRFTLDEAFPDTPIHLYSTCLHVIIVNSCALSRLGLLSPSGTPSAKLQTYIQKGFVDVDCEQRVTGVVSDTAAFRLLCPYFFPGPKTIQQLTHLASLGLTGVQTCDMVCASRYRDLNEAGALPLRVFHTPWIEDILAAAVASSQSLDASEWDQDLVNVLSQLNKEVGTSVPLRQAIHKALNVKLDPTVSDRLVTNRAKIFADGTLGTKTAALSQGYSVQSIGSDRTICPDSPNLNSPNAVSPVSSPNSPPESNNSRIVRCCSLEQHINRGRLCWNSKELDNRIQLLKVLGLRAEVHSIGDRSSSEVLAALKRNEMVGPCWAPVLTHASILSDQTIEDMKNFHVIANVQPTFIPMDTAVFKSVIPKASIPFVFVFKTLMQQGIVCAGGSDSPVCTPDPFIGIFDAMYRPASEKCRGRHSEATPTTTTGIVCECHPQECLTFGEALSLYTIGASVASATFHDPHKWLQQPINSIHSVPMDSVTSAVAEVSTAARSSPLKLGCIDVGFAADFTVVDRNISVDSAQSLQQVKVVSTFIGGQQVYKMR